MLDKWLQWIGGGRVLDASKATPVVIAHTPFRASTSGRPANNVVQFSSLVGTVNATNYLQVIPGGYYDTIWVAGWNVAADDSFPILVGFYTIQGEEGVYAFDPNITAHMAKFPPHVISENLSSQIGSKGLMIQVPLTDKPFAVWCSDLIDAAPVGGARLQVTLSTARH